MKQRSLWRYKVFASNVYWVSTGQLNYFADSIILSHLMMPNFSNQRYHKNQILTACGTLC